MSWAEHARQAAKRRRALTSLWQDDVSGRAAMIQLMGVEPRHVGPNTIAFADEVRHATAEGLLASELVIVGKRLVELLEQASPLMADQMLLETDPTHRDGFLYLTRPTMDRTPGVQFPIHAIHWFEIPAGHAALRGNDDADALVIVPYALTEDVAAVVPELDYGFRLFPIASVIWSFGTPIGTVMGGHAPPPEAGLDPGFYQRLLAAFWALYHQRATEEIEEKPFTPSESRKWSRAGFRNPSSVRLVDVRKRPRKDSTPTGRHIEHDHQWWVSPHWRNQWYARAQAHRQIWIAPHLKGPDDKPIRGTERAFKVD